MILVAVALMCGLFFLFGVFTSRAPSPIVNTGARYSLGEEIRTPSVTFGVESVRFDARGGGPLVPAPGYTFVITTIHMRNISSSTMQMIPLLQFHVRDNRGNVYSEVAAPLLIPEYSGSVLPQDGLREEIAFAVDHNATGLTLYFEPGTVNALPIAVAIPGALGH